jgi:hypothetical protein
VLVATASYMAPNESGSPTRWEVGACINSARALIYTYNDDGTLDNRRDEALLMFRSVELSDLP